MRFILLALLPFILAPTFEKGGGIGKVVIYGDSFVNGDELTAPLASYLGVSEAQIIGRNGEGGLKIDEWTGRPDDRQCTATNSWDYADCRHVVHQLGRQSAAGEWDSSGTCRSYGATKGLTAIDNSMCVGANDPLDCCDGASSGECSLSCVEEITWGPGDYIVVSEMVNSAYTGVGDGDCDGTIDAEWKAAYQVMFDIIDSVGVKAVFFTDVPNIEDGKYQVGNYDRHRCLSNWAATTLQAANPTHIVIDGFAEWEEYQTLYGDQALADMMGFDCDAPLPCDGDGTHPGAVETEFGWTGREYMATRIGAAILELEARRKGR